MKPCAFSDCPALATHGDYCPCHQKAVLVGEVVIVPAAETAAAIDQRKRIARLYKHEDR